MNKPGRWTTADAREETSPSPRGPHAIGGRCPLHRPGAFDPRNSSELATLIRWKDGERPPGNASRASRGAIPRCGFFANHAGLRVVAALSLAWCLAACQAGRYAAHDSPTAPAWQLVMDACATQPDGSARCDVERLKAAMHANADMEADAELCRVDLRECRDLADVDCALWAGRVETCEAKLDSHWRSPWIWGAVGLSVGVVGGIMIAR